MSGRVLSIDVLRLLACGLVLGCHANWPAFDGPLGPLWKAWQTGGWAGVDLFFVLSGFLIGGILLAELERTGTIRVGRFLVRRGWKIYPAFYALIGFVLLFNAVQGIMPFSWRDTLSELFFVQNYGGHLSLQTWSLAVEEHFYLTLPLVLLLVRRRLHLLPWLAAAAAVVCFWVRYATGLPGAHMYTHCRIDSLLFGVLLAYLSRHKAEAFNRFAQRYRPLLVAVGIGLMVPAFLYDHLITPWIHTIGFPMLFVGSGCLLTAAIARPWKPTLPVVWLARLGSYSYSIYLWHAVVLFWVVPLIEQRLTGDLNDWFAVAVYMVLSLALGVYMGRLIEQPCLALRDRLSGRTLPHQLAAAQ